MTAKARAALPKKPKVVRRRTTASMKETVTKAVVELRTLRREAKEATDAAKLVSEGLVPVMAEWPGHKFSTDPIDGIIYTAAYIAGEDTHLDPEKLRKIIGDKRYDEQCTIRSFSSQMVDASVAAGLITPAEVAAAIVTTPRTPQVRITEKKA